MFSLILFLSFSPHLCPAPDSRVLTLRLTLLAISVAVGNWNGSMKTNAAVTSPFIGYVSSVKQSILTSSWGQNNSLLKIF